MKKLEVLVTGRVQGVGFRYFTLRLAQEYGILGKVRNTIDGKVLIIAVGLPEKMELFLQDLRRGPRLALVQDLHITELSAVEDLENFRIEY